MASSYIFGLEARLGAIGWAVYAPAPIAGTSPIVALGTLCFDLPEDEKGRSHAALRGEFRRARRRLRRKRWRLHKTWELCRGTGLIDDSTIAADHDPWQLRAAGLERRLDGPEWASVLIHLTKRRGYFANRKSDLASANAPPEGARMLSAIAALGDRLAGRTLGQMLAQDPEFQGPLGRKRNRQDDYARTVRREDVRHEAWALFQAQRRFGNPHAAETVEIRFDRIAFHQFPLASSLGKVGHCRFEKGERRAPLNAPLSERLRFLARLNVLRIRRASGLLSALTASEKTVAKAVFGTRKSLTWRALRQAIGLPPEERFAGLNYGAVDRETGEIIDPETRGFAHSQGTAAFSQVLPLDVMAELTDGIAETVIFREGLEELSAALTALPLTAPQRNAVETAVRAGAFSGLRGAAHLSAKAGRKLLPHLEAGLDYNTACAAAGYDAQAFDESRLEDIRNPVVRRVLRRAVKQVGALVRRFGAPAAVHIRLARDLGKPLWERRQIADRIEVSTARRAGRRDELAELLDRPADTIGGRDLRRYELWQEQKGRCLYTDAAIAPSDLLDGGNFEIDYILPISRSQDRSRANQVLTSVKANRDKGNRTPFEWLGKDSEAWHGFLARIEAADLSRGKMRHLQDVEFADHERDYARRQITDTRYVARLLHGALARRLRKVVLRSAYIVGPIRRGWGLDRYLIAAPDNDTTTEKNSDDRRHAVNALLLAMIDDDILTRAAFWYRDMDRRGQRERAPRLPPPPPWKDTDALAFEVAGVRDAIVVSRAEIKRKTGALHSATRYAWEVRDGEEVQYERKAVWEIEPRDLDRLKDSEHNRSGTRAALAAWLERAPKTAAARRRFWDIDPPRMPTPHRGGVGPGIRHVRLLRPKTAGIKIRRGPQNYAHYDNSLMVRVDVFLGGKKYFFVPIYLNQLINNVAPSAIISAHKPEDEWPSVSPDHDFRFSLYPNSYVKATARDGRVIEGYYRGIDRATGALLISSPSSRQSMQRVGGRLLAALEKHTIDVLGIKRPAAGEQRTWHGKVCT